MSDIDGLIDTTFRDFVTYGDPSSLKYKPRKDQVRALLKNMGALTQGAQAGGGIIFGTLASANAHLNYDAFKMAWVVLDPVAANNGVYQKLGASGAGSWSRLANLPYSFYRAINAGAGTANAIVATNIDPVASSDALVIFNITATNTASPVSVAFNGGAGLRIQTASGHDPIVGALVAGMLVAGFIDGTYFRMLSDQSSAAIQAAAEAAQAAAEDARDLAIQAADTAATLGAGDIPLYPSRAIAAALTTIPVGRTYIAVAGFAAPGDAPVNVYRRLGSTPSPVLAQHFQASGAYWELATFPVDIRMLGASTTASGATNAAAINSALAFSQEVVAPAGTFDVGATLVTGAYRNLRGAGKFQTVFNKTFNGDFIQLGTGSNIEGVGILGNGASHTGRAVTIATGTGAQWITGSRIVDFSNYCVEYLGASAGTQGGIGGGTSLGRTTDLDVCVKYPDDGGVASPRYLMGVLCEGHFTLCDTAGANNLFIIGGYCGNITFSSVNSGKVLVWGTRIALVGATMTVRGADLIMDGCAIAGDVVWLAGAGSAFGENNILTGKFTDSTNSSNVSKLHFPASLDTGAGIWKGGTSDPAVGNGGVSRTVSGRGKFRTYSLFVQIGSTTTLGVGDWYFPLHGSNEVAKTYTTGAVWGLDAGTAFLVGVCFIEAGDNKIKMVSGGLGGFWAAATPHAWAAGDYFKLSIDIELV